MNVRLLFIGALVLMVGIGLVAGGVVDIVRSQGAPDDGSGNFWLIFIGGPLVWLGLVFCVFAFARPLARFYSRNWIQPMAKVIAKEFGRPAEGPGAQHSVRCAKCGTDNPPGSRFCNICGSALGEGNVCPSCQEANQADARFCRQCGARLET